MDHSNHTNHQQDVMGHDMHEGQRKTGPNYDDHTAHHAHMVGVEADMANFGLSLGSKTTEDQNA